MVNSGDGLFQLHNAWGWCDLSHWGWSHLEISSLTRLLWGWDDLKAELN